jgi:hypothetical protein
VSLIEGLCSEPKVSEAKMVGFENHNGEYKGIFEKRSLTKIPLTDQKATINYRPRFIHFCHLRPTISEAKAKKSYELLSFCQVLRGFISNILPLKESILLNAFL